MDGKGARGRTACTCGLCWPLLGGRRRRALLGPCATGDRACTLLALIGFGSVTGWCGARVAENLPGTAVHSEAIAVLLQFGFRFGMSDISYCSRTCVDAAPADWKLAVKPYAAAMRNAMSWTVAWPAATGR